MRTPPNTGYDRDSVLKSLQTIRQAEVPFQTFYRWLDILCITPKKLYSISEVKQLKQAALHFRLGGTVKELKQSLLEEIRNEKAGN